MSIVGHLVALGLGGLVISGLSGRPAPVPVPPRPAPRNDTVEIELPTMLDGTLAAASPGARDLLPEPLPRGGGDGMPRPDMNVRGRGGDDTSPDPAINLADRDDQLLLSPEIQSRLDRSQIQRIRSSKHRASREDWRASREPMELTFLASGRAGTRPERRTPADSDPSLGALDRGAPQRQGSILGAAEVPPGVGPARDVGGPLLGADHPSPGMGVRDGVTGTDQRDSARVALGRPWVQEGTPSIPAITRGKPSDTLDSEQEVATAMQSIIQAGRAGGAQGPGAGGQRGPGAPGSGGASGPGSISRALGTGQGNGLDNDPRDQRRTVYLRQVMSQIGRYFTQDAMPKWAQLEGKQGMAIVTFTILADGAIASVTLSRPSGIPEYDDNCRRIVLRAAPFAPLPAEIGQSLRFSVPFNLSNPAVRPKSPRADASP